MHIAEKRPKLANRQGHHDNAKSHITLIIREKLLQFDTTFFVLYYIQILLYPICFCH